MKIAVPTDDGSSVSAHFGRSANFLVFDVENGEIKGQETRANAAHTAPAEGEHHGHDHAAIADILAGCEVVLCRGMGWRAAEALIHGNIIPVIVESAGTAEELVSAYLKGLATKSQHGFCSCSHSGSGHGCGKH